jgi:KUP system potassium uptake protein
MMLIWFHVGHFRNSSNNNTEVLKAINPYYAYNLLAYILKDFFVLGFVFSVQLVQKLCTQIWGIVDVKISESVGFCKITLVLNYFGQAATFKT